MSAWKASFFCLLACSTALGQASSVTISAGATGFGQVAATASATYSGPCMAVDGEGSPIYGTVTVTVPGGGGCTSEAQMPPSIQCYSEQFVPPGQYTVTASYSGFTGTDGAGNACTVSGSSASGPVTAPYGSTSVLLNQNPPTTLQAGQLLTLPLTFTAEDGLAYYDNPTPTAKIDLADGTLVLASAPLGSSTGDDGVKMSYDPTINVSTKGAAPGMYSVNVKYPGDANYASSQTSSFPLKLLPAQLATTTSLSVTPNPTVERQPTGIRATVTPTGVTVPSGTVTLLAGSTQIATIPLTNGTGTITAPADIAPGSYQVRAIYSGDGFNIASTSPAVSVTVDAQTSTTTSVTVSPSTIAAGATAQLTATVTPAISNVVPTGTVTITANGATVATLPLKNGAASEQLSTAGLPAGTYSVVGKYSGSSLATASTSPAAMVTIEAASSVSVVASPNPVARGTVTTLTATVKNGSGGLVTSGTVTFSDAGSTLGTAKVGTNGEASLPIGTSSFSNGTYTITASFGGSGSVPAAMGTVSLVVN